MSINAVHKSILEEFVAANITFDPDRFLPYLNTEYVVVSASWQKEDFYDFFSKMLCCAQERVVGDMYPKIIKSNLNDFTYEYNFYDQTHLYSLITFELKFLDDKIYFEIYPF